MDTLLILLATLVIWVGGFFFVRWLMRNRVASLEQRYADPGTFLYEQLSFELYRVSEPMSKNRAVEYVEYTLHVPVLRGLCIIDGESRHRRTTLLTPRQVIQTVGSPATDDEVFNGIFDFTRPMTDKVADLLNDEEVRTRLLELRQAFGGLWVDGGTIRVVEKGDFEESAATVNFELIAGVVAVLNELENRSA